MTVSEAEDVSPARPAKRRTARPVFPQQAERRVGVEVEFGGMSAREAADIVQYHQGGVLEVQDAHRFVVRDGRLGDLKVELDSKYVHSPETASDFERKVRRFAGEVGGSIVPTELITGPLPAADLGEVDRLVNHLAEAGALGTRQPHLACGLHLNIEWTGRDVAPILAILRAYMLCAENLRADIGLDTTRTLLPFIGRYPKTYQARVLDPGYAPDIETFIRDYCAANPTKNRELDLLPLLASIDEDLVSAALGHPPVAVRPTFHYRLPNAAIDEPDWSIAGEWRRWLGVEELARDPDRLEAALAGWQEASRSSSPVGLLRDMFNKVIN